MSQSAYDYCREKVALPGSSLYYSLLLVTPELRATLTALHAAVEEFRELLEHCSDEQVARVKLVWWVEEMQRACAGQARHPVTRVLAAPLQRAGVDGARFVALLEELGAHFAHPGYATLDALESHYQRVADITGTLAAELCGYRQAGTLAAGRALGAGLELAALARRPQRRAGRRVTDLPEQTLALGGASAADVSAAISSPGLKKAVALVAERARARLQASLLEMPAEDHAAQCSRRALAAMELAQLDALARAGYAALERPRGVTPLRKLWIAWKHRPREQTREHT